MRIDAKEYTAKKLNAAIANSDGDTVEIEGVVGQRYLGAALTAKRLVIDGTPGNALGAYLDGAEIELFGNAQEATGDTMNGGEIVIHGNAGDATGYAMRGGKIFIEGDVGYRCGIHMKAYRDNKPAIVIGGKAGSFLGEYLAGGTIVVLGGDGGEQTVGNFCGTGMHGGEIWVKAGKLPATLPPQVRADRVNRLPCHIEKLVEEWCEKFGKKAFIDTGTEFFRLTPDSANPYKRLYTAN